MYLKDIKTRLKEIAYDGHKHLLENRILPYWGNKPINLITPADIKNWQKAQISTLGKVNVTSPKTPESNREITIPQLLVNDLNNYIKHIYDYKKTDRVFPYTKAILYNELKAKSEPAGLKKIRVNVLPSFSCKFID